MLSNTYMSTCALVISQLCREIKVNPLIFIDPQFLLEVE